MEEIVLTPADYIKIVQRRIWYLVVPCFLVIAIAGVVALVLPSVYKSTATILIEQREIPAEYVKSSMTTYAEQRIQSINQRVLTSTRLRELIDRFDLYSELRQKVTIDEVIAKMEEDVRLEPVNIEVADRRSGRTATATIAFTLSYEGRNPRKVQQVANTITSLFLKADIKVRKEQASSTYEFLKTESMKIRQQVAEYEKKLADFKEAHVHSLPQLFQVNMQTLDNIQRSIDQAKQSLRTLKQKKSQMEQELANTPMDIEGTFPETGRPRHEDEARLEALEMKLIEMKTKFSDLYPDVKKLKQTIRDLSEKVEQSKKQRKAEKKESLQSSNPAYVSLSSRLAGIKTDIQSVKNNLQDFEKEALVYKARLTETPSVEEKYNALTTERNSLKAKFNDLQAKMMEAKVAQELESEQKGERFTLIESARLPEKPFKPNRLAILLIGVVLGIGAGVGCAALVEFSDSSVRNGETLARAIGFPVLTEVPVIVTTHAQKKKSKKMVFMAAGAAAAFAVVIILFHVYVMDLGIFWIKLMRKMP